MLTFIKKSLNFSVLDKMSWIINPLFNSNARKRTTDILIRLMFILLYDPGYKHFRVNHLRGKLWSFLKGKFTYHTESRFKGEGRT